jgi:hypothetical protein
LLNHLTIPAYNISVASPINEANVTLNIGGVYEDTLSLCDAISAAFGPDGSTLCTLPAGEFAGNQTITIPKDSSEFALGFKVKAKNGKFQFRNVKEAGSKKELFCMTGTLNVVAAEDEKFEWITGGNTDDEVTIHDRFPETYAPTASMSDYDYQETATPDEEEIDSESIFPTETDEEFYPFSEPTETESMMEDEYDEYEAFFGSESSENAEPTEEATEFDFMTMGVDF